MIFKNATIITVDPDRRVIQDGAIAVEGSRIAGVGKREDILREFPDDKEHVDLKGKLVIPGLINTHVHQSQALIRGCADDLALVEWLYDRVWQLQGRFDEDDGRISAELTILELLKSGTTAFCETMIAGRYGFDGIAKAVESSGIRAALSKIIMDASAYTDENHQGTMFSGMVEDREASFQEALDMYDKWDGKADDRIQVWFGPRPPGGSSSELLKEMMEAANQRGMGIHIHLAEVKDDVEYMRNSFNMTPVEYIESVNMVGPRVLLIHCVQLKNDDILRLAKTGTNVAHNPVCNAKLASGIAPIAEMLNAGVNVGLGTDGGPSNNSYDMINDMRWASYLQKVKLDDERVMPAETVMEMATLNGAKILGWEDRIGSIEVGKQADFVALDMNKPHLTPAPDPVSTIVCAANGSDVDTVVIGGKIVVEGRKVLTMDEERILAEANERARKLYERAGIHYGPRWPVV